MAEKISLERLKAQMEEYFKACAEIDVFPDLAGMRIALGITREQMQRLSEREGFEKLFSEARDRRESYLVRAMTADNRRTSGCMNALKQKENGGYAEKNEPSGQTLVIKLEGIEGGMESFK